MTADSTPDKTPDGTSTPDRTPDSTGADCGGVTEPAVTRTEATPSETGSRSAPLNAVVVRYGDAPNRCTVSPVGVSGEERLTTWLSVDAAVLQSLESMR